MDEDESKRRLREEVELLLDDDNDLTPTEVYICAGRLSALAMRMARERNGDL